MLDTYCAPPIPWCGETVSSLLEIDATLELGNANVVPLDAVRIEATRPRIIIPCVDLQEQVLAVPIYVERDRLVESTEILRDELQPLTYGSIELTTCVSPLSQNGFDLIYYPYYEYDWRELTRQSVSVVIDNVVRVLGDVLRYLQKLQNEKANAVFVTQRALNGIIKALHKPLQVIPKSIRPIEATT